MHNKNILTLQQFNFTVFTYRYSHVPLRQSYCVYIQCTVLVILYNKGLWWRQYYLHLINFSSTCYTGRLLTAKPYVLYLMIRRKLSCSWSTSNRSVVYGFLPATIPQGPSSPCPWVNVTAGVPVCLVSATNNTCDVKDYK